ncbi:MAG: hypothetical protein ISP68_03590 [Flavobacteriaceae bacterium]|nr:hypothetical protein [Flavobacteriaceae bacterium]
MMKAKLPFFILFLFIWFGCDEDSNNQEWVDVSYVTPMYKSTSDLADEIFIDEPKVQTGLGKIVTYGDMIFINQPMEGIHIVDNSNPANPMNHSFISIPGNVDMAIVDNHLYADMFSALVVFDLSNLESPKFLEDFTVEDVFYYDSYWNFPNEIWEEGHVRFAEYVDASMGIVVGWETEVRRERVDNTYGPELAFDDVGVAVPGSDVDFGSNTSTAGSMARFLPIDGYLYTINFSDLVLFQLAQNYKPNPWIRIDTQTQAETLFHLNDLLFVGSVNGMLMYDVADASDPLFINKIEHMRSCDPVVADLEYAYVTLRGGTNCFTDLNELQIIDIQTPEDLQVVSHKSLFNPHGLGIYEDHLIICDGSAGIKVLDVTDRSQPEIMTSYPIGFAYDVIIDYPNAMVVGEEMLFQYDLSDLPELTLLSQTPIHSSE